LVVTSIISALWSLREEESKFEASLGYIQRQSEERKEERKKMKETKKNIVPI
jgi:hypothetical protein